MYNNIYDERTKNFLLNSQNKDGNTPAHLAILSSNQNLVEHLDKMGADLSLSNNEDLVIKLTDSDSECKKNNVFSTTSTELPSKNVILSTTSNDSEIKNIISKLLIESKKKLPKMDVDFELSTINSTINEPPKIIKQYVNINDSYVKNHQRDNSTENYMMLLAERKMNEMMKRNKLGQYGGNVTNSETFQGTRQLVQIKKNKQSSNSKLSNSESSNNMLNTSQNSITSESLGIAHLLNQFGGADKNKKSSKQNSSKQNSSKQNSSKRYTSNRSSVSRKNKPSSDIHTEVIEIIKKMGYSEDDARFIKAGLYQMIKDKYPNLSNMQRAIKLKEMTNKEEVEKMSKHLPKLKELVVKAREQRKTEKENSNKTSKKESKKKDKTSKEDKKTKELKESKDSKESKKETKTKKTKA